MLLCILQLSLKEILIELFVVVLVLVVSHLSKPLRIRQPKLTRLKVYLLTCVYTPYG